MAGKRCGSRKNRWDQNRKTAVVFSFPGSARVSINYLSSALRERNKGNGIASTKRAGRERCRSPSLECSTISGNWCCQWQTKRAIEGSARLSEIVLDHLYCRLFGYNSEATWTSFSLLILVSERTSIFSEWLTSRFVESLERIIRLDFETNIEEERKTRLAARHWRQKRRNFHR